MYALLFADSGLNTGEISSLFVLWSVTVFVLEVPSGAWADAFSRRRMLALSGLLRGVGFALWVAWPSYQAFAAGFVLWGVSGAMQSGTEAALVYDELAAVRGTDRYVAIVGRGGAVALVAVMVATGLAAPALALGGYGLVGAASVAVCLAYAGVALSFPETPRVRVAAVGGGADGLRRYAASLRAGLTEARATPVVRRAVLLAAVVPGLTALDEYLPLLAREMGASTVAVPLLLLLPAGAMAVAGALAGRYAAAPARWVAAALAAAAVLLMGGALAGHPVGMIAVAASFGLLQTALVLTEARLQEVISGPARATVLSTAGFGAEVAAVAIYVAVGAGAEGGLPVASLVALTGVPIVLVSLAAARWLPAPREFTETTEKPGTVRAREAPERG